MRNFLIQYPWGLKLRVSEWLNLPKNDENTIRSSFNVNLYLDYLNAINNQPKSLRNE